jgi:glycosyltransferase 2 family protein
MGIETRKLAGIAGRARWRRILYAVGIVLGLALLAQQAWQGYSALRQVQACVVQPGFLLAALALYVVAYFVQMAAWALIMRALQASLSPQAVVEGYALSFLPRYIPGSVWGYLSRNEWLAQNHRVSYRISTTASLLEAALLLVTAGLLGALFWLPILWQMPLLEPGIIASGVLASWLAWRTVPWLAARLTGKHMQDSVAPRQDLALWGATTLLYVAFWGLQGGALVAITQTLCGGFMLGVFAATAAFALAWAIGFLVVFVPAGLGVREWTLSALLMLFAMLQPGQATLLAVISRFGLIIAEVVVLLIGLQGQIRSRWRNGARITDHPSSK